MNLLELTKKLIATPSFVAEDANEADLGEFVFEYLQRFPFLRVEKQKVEGGRFNIIAQTKGDPRLFFAGHLDTVQPKKGWTKKQFEGEVVDGNLFGLGSLDTKSGVAALLHSLNDFKDVAGLTMLFYCDEEYDFKGMKKFIKDYNEEVGDYAVFIEPTALSVCNMHRGLVEVKVSVKGKTGHAKRPESGCNAIIKSAQVVSSFKDYIATFEDDVSGKSSMNVAYFRGGLNLGKDEKGEVVVGKEGNNIADFAEFVVDVRPSFKKLDAENIISWFREELEKRGCVLESSSVRHDYNSLYTAPESIVDIERVIKEVLGKVSYLGPEEMGYGEAPLVQKKYSIPVIYFGPKGGNAHGADEYVDFSSVEKCREVYRGIIASITGAR